MQLREGKGKEKMECIKCIAKEKALNASVGSVSPSTPLSPSSSSRGVLAMKLEEVRSREGGVEGEPLKLMTWLTQQFDVMGGRKSEGVFRLSVAGSTLHECIDHVAKCDPPHYTWPSHISDVNCLCALLKAWLRDMPTPLLPDYEVCVPTFTSPQHDEMTFSSPDHYQNVLLSLPDVHLHTLKTLQRFLCSISEEYHVKSTRMHLDNLSLVFSQCILRNPSPDPLVMLTNQPREHKFLRALLQHMNQQDQLLQNQ